MLARAYPERTPGKKSPINFREVNKDALSNARLIEDYARELGDQVLAKQITFFVVACNERRPLTISQKAMGYALNFPDPSMTTGRRNLSEQSDRSGVSKGHWKNGP